MRTGKFSVVVPRPLLLRQFRLTQPNQSWVTNITYVRTHEGWP